MMYYMRQKMKNYQDPGLVLSVDFEKTFDTVSWEFINKTLVYFIFGPSIRNR